MRITAGAVYELPFGAGKSRLANGGLWSTLASGWQTAGTFEYQPGSLIQRLIDPALHGRAVLQMATNWAMNGTAQRADGGAFHSIL